MTQTQQQAVLIKWMALGYRALTPAEQLVIAYRVTPGGCPSRPR